jgi:putative holliday junction resolvase
MGRILGVDYGRRRVGIALSDETAMLAMPLLTVEVTDVAGAVEAVRNIATERRVSRIVVGLPLNMNGTRGPMADEVGEFVKRVVEATALPVDTYDERLSSGLVERMLVDADLSRARRKTVRDKLAAQVILQSYIDSRDVSE